MTHHDVREIRQWQQHNWPDSTWRITITATHPTHDQPVTFPVDVSAPTRDQAILSAGAFIGAHAASVPRGTRLAVEAQEITQPVPIAAAIIGAFIGADIADTQAAHAAISA